MNVLIEKKVIQNHLVYRPVERNPPLTDHPVYNMEMKLNNVEILYVNASLILKLNPVFINKEQTTVWISVVFVKVYSMKGGTKFSNPESYKSETANSSGGRGRRGGKEVRGLRC